MLLVDGYNVLGAAIDYNSSDDDDSQLQAAFADSSRDVRYAGHQCCGLFAHCAV